MGIPTGAYGGWGHGVHGHGRVASIAFVIRLADGRIVPLGIGSSVILLDGSVIPAYKCVRHSSGESRFHATLIRMCDSDRRRSSDGFARNFGLPSD